MENFDNSNEIKAILVGKSGVGKTNLINTCAGFAFNSSSVPTMNNTFLQKRFNINKKEYIINLWDTISQEQYNSVNRLFYRNAEIVIFVFDVTKRDSLEELDHWIDIIKEELGTNFVCGIVGNKNDLFLDAQVNEDEANEFAKQRGMKCQFVSAKTDPNRFSEFIEKLITEPISANKLKDPKDITNNNNNNNDSNNTNMTVLNKKRGQSIKLVSQKANSIDKNNDNKNSRSKSFWFC